jgi:putative nucleotidyltransferase with HDIG domain
MLADLEALAALEPRSAARIEAERALRVLGEVFSAGIRSPELERAGGVVFSEGAGSASISFEEAASMLRAGIEAERIQEPAAGALFRLLRGALRPNLVFDAEATRVREEAAVASLGPVEVSVAAGDTVVLAGQRADAEVQEALAAYRAALLSDGSALALSDERFFARALQVFAVLLAALFYLRLHDPRTLQSNSRLALLVLVTLLNLLLIRVALGLGGLPVFAQSAGAASSVPYLAPVTLAPLFLTILLGTGPGVFMALVVSFFAGVIHGGRFDVMVMSFLASLVAIYACQTIRLRSQVVRAAALSGAAMASAILLIGLADGVPMQTLLLQMAAGFGTCTLTGFLVAGMLPLLEALFRRTTDITLLELTDYNHPLLRRLQMDAPGTYHHSLVVANLSENAAAAIGANPLLARVCALFHDIGKLVKPEYFTENQRGSHNPHDLRNPSMSALIIKSHVKEGVALAREHKLPPPVLDAIREHHGTTLMQFFFQRARERSRGRAALAQFPAESVPEGIYRYDGPKPGFRESAILHLADPVEAAARSLRKVTPQSVAELVEEITEGRVADGQLDECPLTLEELSRIKSSFTFTLLNMLHGRVSYAPAQPQAAEAGEAAPSGVVRIPPPGGDSTGRSAGG